MTNGEKYNTAEERIAAFQKYVEAKKINLWDFFSTFKWLDLEAEEEKPLPCPFCGNDVHITCENGKFSCRCSCGYSSTEENKSSSDAISAHNRVAKFVND